ncbi:MAG: response regulator, partial [Bacteroidota bacterium]
MMLKAVLVEDEERGMRALELKLQEHCPDVQIIAKCWTAQEAIETLRQTQTDVVFLDVRLDQKTGFDILLELPTLPFEVIFVSGYEEYAIRAFREGALDYILKPIDVEELKRAVQKVRDKAASSPKIDRLIVPISFG